MHKWVLSCLVTQLLLIGGLLSTYQWHVKISYIIGDVMRMCGVIWQRSSGLLLTISSHNREILTTDTKIKSFRGTKNKKDN